MEENFSYKRFVASSPAEEITDACHKRWPKTFDKNNLHLLKKIFLYSDFNGCFSPALQSVTHDRASQKMNMPLNDEADARSPSGVQCCYRNKNSACLTVLCTLSDLEQDENVHCATTSAEGTSSISVENTARL